MTRFILKRILQGILTAWVIVTILFIVFRTMPGDPTYFLVDPELPEESRELVRERLGLNKPLATQYFIYLSGLAKGDLGESLWYSVPVSTIIGEKFFNTLILALLAFVLQYSLGIIGGIVWAATRRSRFESVSTIFALGVRSMPQFWLGIVMVMIFGVALKLFPTSGIRESGYVANTLAEKYLDLDFLHHLILPVAVLTLSRIAIPMLLLKDTILELYGEDFMDLIKAKGVSRVKELWHAARNAFIPIVTTAAISLGTALGGQVMVEVVFSWPGLGREIIASVSRRDYSMAQSSFLLLSLTVIGFNLLADIAYRYLDPRISET